MLARVSHQHKLATDSESINSCIQRWFISYFLSIGPFPNLELKETKLYYKKQDE